MIELVVWYRDREIGRIEATEPDQLVFTYDPRWIAAADAFAVSVSLPLQAAPFTTDAAPAYFTNLLPEGDARAAVCAALGISVGNDVALLRALGGECAGALTILEPGRRPPDPQLHSYELLDTGRLRSLVRHEVAPLLIGGARTRLSLAGAQNKVPIAVLDDQLHLALDGAPSTHILKLPHPHFPDLALNEGFVMGLARAIGFEVASTEVRVLADRPCLLVERYDRTLDEDGDVVRWHQEDLCQALGLSSARKYEQEGGPSLARAVALITASAQRPIVDTRRLIEWQAFNVIAGNCDGHGKNLSLLYGHRAARLAPFYDLVSTRHYPRLDRLLAMSIGGRRDPTQLHRAQWTALAADADLGAKIVLDAVRSVAERVTDALPAWVRDYRRHVGRRAILERLPTVIAQNTRRVLRHLAS